MNKRFEPKKPKILDFYKLAFTTIMYHFCTIGLLKILPLALKSRLIVPFSYLFPVICTIKFYQRTFN